MDQLRWLNFRYIFTSKSVPWTKCSILNPTQKKKEKKNSKTLSSSQIYWKTKLMLLKWITSNITLFCSPRIKNCWACSWGCLPVSARVCLAIFGMWIYPLSAYGSDEEALFRLQYAGVDPLGAEFWGPCSLPEVCPSEHPLPTRL